MSYEFREYPKHITVDGKTVVVNNADEEAQASSSGEVVREEDERRRLVALADVKGVQVDKRWRLDRIAQAIRDAGHDPEINPFA